MVDASGTVESDVSSAAKGFNLHKVRVDPHGKRIGKSEYYTPQSQQLIDTGSEMLMSINLQAASQVGGLSLQLWHSDTSMSRGQHLVACLLAWVQTEHHASPAMACSDALRPAAQHPPPHPQTPTPHTPPHTQTHPNTHTLRSTSTRWRRSLSTTRAAGCTAAWRCAGWRGACTSLCTRAAYSTCCHR